MWWLEADIFFHKAEHLCIEDFSLREKGLLIFDILGLGLVSKGYLASFITDTFIEGEDSAINFVGPQCIEYVGRKYNLNRSARMISVC